MPPPRVSIVIPCLNEARRLAALLDRLAGQDQHGSEILVVDGGSEDGSQEVVLRWAAAHRDVRLRLLQNPGRHIPHALNLGIASAQGDVILRMDGHALPARDYVRQCLGVLAESGASVVGGGWTVRPGASTPAARAVALAVSSPLGAGDARYRLVGDTQPGEVETVPFGCFRRETWTRAEGYNENLLTNEDYEFNLRVRAQGGRVYFDPRIRSEYFAQPTLAGLAAQYWRYGWWKAQTLKRHPRSLRLRQALPLAWSLGGLALLPLALFGWIFAALTLAAWGVYLAVVALTARNLAERAGERGLWPSLVAAFVLIHFAWGWGAWSGLVRRGVRAA